MENFNLEEIKRMVLIGQNEGPAGEIHASVPHDKGWTHIGEDYYWDGDFTFAGPSGGDSDRTTVSGYNPVCCPVCNGIINPFADEKNHYCGCQLLDVRAHYGLE